MSVGDEYDWVFTYVGLDKASDWKLAEFTRALGLPEKGKLNIDKLKGKMLRIKLNPGEYNGEYRPDPGKFFKGESDDTPGRVSQGSTSSNGASPAAEEPEADAAAESPTYKAGFEPSRESDPEVGSYDEWEDADLFAEAEDRGLTLAGGRGKKRDKAIDALRAEDAEVEGGSAAAEPEAAAEAAGDDYADWDIAQLTKEWEERQFDEPVPVKKGRNAEERTRQAIIEGLRADDEANPFEA
jgi:hypothetical protein